jgi:hypothetical protein
MTSEDKHTVITPYLGIKLLAVPLQLYEMIGSHGCFGPWISQKLCHQPTIFITILSLKNLCMPQRALHHLCLSQTCVLIVTDPQTFDITFLPHLKDITRRNNPIL